MDNLTALQSALSKVGKSVSRVVFPVPGGRVSQSVGPGHVAVDIAAPLGSPVYAPVFGKVTQIRRQRTGYGTNVRLLTPEGEELIFAHLGDVNVRPGQTVSAGSLLGRIGMTGYTSGPHVHFERRRPGPDRFVAGSRSTTTALDPWELLKSAAQRAAGSFRASPPPRNLTALSAPSSVAEQIRAARRGRPVVRDRGAETRTVQRLAQPTPPRAAVLPGPMGVPVRSTDRQQAAEWRETEDKSSIMSPWKSLASRALMGSAGFIIMVVGLFILSSGLREAAKGGAVRAVRFVAGTATGGPATGAVAATVS